MKKGLLGSTAIVAATVFTVGAASAAEAPTAKLGGFVTFQAIVPSTDTTSGVTNTRSIYFEVDDAEISVAVSGTSDSGLNYGFKVEIEAGQGAAGGDEAYLTLGGSFGKLEIGDNDGVEDSLLVDGVGIQGASGGADGDIGDWYAGVGSGAPGGTGINANTGDATKITYYSNDMSGFKAGISYTPQASEGNNNTTATATPGGWENNIAIGANYSTEMGNMAITAGAVYATASGIGTTPVDQSGFAVGATVGFGQFTVGLAYADNGDASTNYYDIGASFANGPMSASVGYFVGTNTGGPTDTTITNIGLTADYALAEGFGVYGEYVMVDEDNAGTTNSGSAILLGAKASF